MPFRPGALGRSNLLWADQTQNLVIASNISTTELVVHNLDFGSHFPGRQLLFFHVAKWYNQASDSPLGYSYFKFGIGTTTYTVSNTDLALITEGHYVGTNGNAIAGAWLVTAPADVVGSTCWIDLATQRRLNNHGLVVWALQNAKVQDFSTRGGNLPHSFALDVVPRSMVFVADGRGDNNMGGSWSAPMQNDSTSAWATTAHGSFASAASVNISNGSGGTDGAGVAICMAPK